MSKEPLKVGQSVYLVTRGFQSYGTVMHVGRKWATLDYPKHRPLRINIQTWEVDDKYYMGYSAYESAQQYKEVTEMRTAIVNLARRITPSPNVGVTLADVQEAARLLRIDINKN